MNSLAIYKSDELKNILVLVPHLQEIFEMVENRQKNKKKPSHTWVQIIETLKRIKDQAINPF